MACIEKIYSVSALIGKPTCNAKCGFCAAKDLRQEALCVDDDLYWRNYAAAIKLSARYGGWSLSLTSSGEPTCDPQAVTKALEVYQECANQGAYFPNVNLFTNGIMFGNTRFCNEWLPEWKQLGLTNIAVSIHDISSVGQAKVYGISDYPALWQIFGNIKSRGIGARATILLRKGGIETARGFEEAVNYTNHEGCKNITAWPVSNPDGSRCEFTPSRLNLWKIRLWLKNNAKLCHGHVWGGGVYDWDGTIIRMTDYVTRHDPKKDYVRQLVVFQDGTVAYSWIREGALCMI